MAILASVEIATAEPFRPASQNPAWHVLSLTWPVLVEQILSLAVGLVSTYLVGHLGAAALAAVGLSTQLTFLLMAVFSAVGVGSTALIARAVGAGEIGAARHFAGQSLLLAVGVGLLTVLPCVLWGRSLLTWLGGEAEVVALGGPYLAVTGAALPLTSLLFIGNSALRGAGDTRTPMLVMALVNAVNIVVAWGLVNGAGPLPALGVLGAGLGSAAGTSVGGLLVTAILLRGGSRARLHVTRETLRLQPRVAWRLLRVGLPSGAEQAFLRAAQLGTAAVVAQLGTAAYAGHQLGLQMLSISFMPGFAFSVAATTLVGQELGRGLPRRAQEYAYTTAWMTFGVMSAMGAAAFSLAERVLGLFTTDAEVIVQGVRAVHVGALMQPALAWFFALAGALRGAGDTAFVLLSQAVPIWLVRVPLAYLLGLSMGLGLEGVWLGMLLDMVGRAVLLLWRFRRGRWKTLKV